MNDVQHNNKNNCDATLILLARKRAQVQLFTKPSTLYSTHFPTFSTFLVKPAHYTRVTFLEKSSPKVSTMLPKTGTSNQPWLTANAKLGTLFFGTLRNQDFQSWKSCLLSSSMFFRHGRTNGNLVLTVRTDVKGASRNNVITARGFHWFVQSQHCNTKP